jgi:hypothetical protein
MLKRRLLPEHNGNIWLNYFSAELKFVLKKIGEERHNVVQIIDRTMHIASTTFNFNVLDDADSARLFRFESKHVGEILRLLG